MLSLAGCSWFDDNDAVSGNDTSSKEQATSDTNSNFIDIMSNQRNLRIDQEALEQLSLSEPHPIDLWPQEGGNIRQAVPHISGSSLKDIHETVTVGDGYDWINAAIAPSPVVTKTQVIAMDGHGVVSAHMRSDISETLWVSEVVESDSPLLTGGIAATNDQIFAVTGRGSLVALNAKDGALLWSYQSDEPIRSSIRIHEDQLYIVTADSQLIALRQKDGSVVWQHRGVGEESGLFGTSLPIIVDRSVVIAYPSGDIFRLDPYNGKTLWSDSLIRPRRTMAIGLFSGVDATPASDGEMIFAGSSSGLFSAHTVKGGIRIWELPVGSSHSPWVDQELLFMVTESDNLIAVSKYQGNVGWRTSLLDADREENEALPRYFGPFLINETLVTLLANGDLVQNTPLTGSIIRRESLFDSVAASPAFAGKSAYILGNNATLYEVR